MLRVCMRIILCMMGCCCLFEICSMQAISFENENEVLLWLWFTLVLSLAFVHFWARHIAMCNVLCNCYDNLPWGESCDSSPVYLRWSTNMVGWAMCLYLTEPVARCLGSLLTKPDTTQLMIRISRYRCMNTHMNMRIASQIAQYDTVLCVRYNGITYLSCERTAERKRPLRAYDNTKATKLRW